MSAESTGQALYVLTHDELTQLARGNNQDTPPHAWLCTPVYAASANSLAAVNQQLIDDDDESEEAHVSLAILVCDKPQNGDCIHVKSNLSYLV